MKNRFIKLLLAAVLLGSLSPAAAQTREMDLSESGGSRRT